MRRLQDDPDPGLDRLQGIFPVIFAVDADGTLLGLVEPAHQVDDGRFTATRRVDQGDRLATPDMQAEILQHRDRPSS